MATYLFFVVLDNAFCSDKLMARKIDVNVDASVIQEIDKRIKMSQ